MRKRIFLLIALGLAARAGAQWVPDGRVVCDAARDQNVPATVPDGKGGVIIVWEDMRSGSYDIYAQRVDGNGFPVWNTHSGADSLNGVAVCTAVSNQYSPIIVSDGAGGAIIVWEDYRNGTDYNIYAQRVDSLGQVRWVVDGVPICTAANNQVSPAVVTDGAGGAIITWSDYRSGSNYDIYAQRVDASGARGWTTDGVVVCNNAANQYLPTITSNGAGGAIIIWTDYRTGILNIYGQKIDNSGVGQWTANGVVFVSGIKVTQTNPYTVADGSGGAYVLWDCYDNSSGYGIVESNTVIRITSSGSVSSGWNSGVAITGKVSKCNIVKSNASGIFAASSENTNIYMRRISSNGGILWTNLVCTAPDTQKFPAVFSDGNWGVLVAWQDYRNGSADIYVQKIDSLGFSFWLPQGLVTCKAANNQLKPTVVNDNAGGAIVAWYDYRNGIDNDIYAQRIDSLGRNNASIISISDIPADQGGNLRIAWAASAKDSVGLITQYSVWRALPETKTVRSQTLDEPGKVALGTKLPVYYFSNEGGKVFAWECLIAFPAIQDPIYYYTAATLYDSIGTTPDSMNRAVFRVLAHTSNQFVYYPSPVDSGYSVDNLVPAKVRSLSGQVVKGIKLAWKANQEDDLYDYAVYFNGAYMASVAETTYTYGGSLVPNDYFTVAARDVHGNLGPQSDPWQYLGVAGPGNTVVAPDRDALNGARPNPFRQTVTLKYQLAKPARMALRVYNVGGQLVRTVAEGSKPAGYYTAGWDGRDDRGRKAQAGVYVYRLEAGEQRFTGKVTLIR